MTPVQSRILQLQEATGKNMRDFSADAGFATSWLSNFKNGKAKRCSSTSIDRICRAYPVSRHWLETGEGEMFLPAPKKPEPEQPAPKPIQTVTINGEAYIPASLAAAPGEALAKLAQLRSDCEAFRSALSILQAHLEELEAQYAAF